MALHDTSNPLISTPISMAEKIRRSEPDRLWLECFHYCKRRRNISATVEEYEFRDGSTLMLNTSSAIPSLVLEKR